MAELKMLAIDLGASSGRGIVGKFDGKKFTVEENHRFRKENGKFYRISKVYRIVIERENNSEIKKELILDNHSLVMYDYSLIPSEQIRDD